MEAFILMAAAVAQIAAPAMTASNPIGQAAATAPAAASGPADRRCVSAPFSIGGDVDVLQAWRATAGADGASHVERVALPGKRGSHYGGSVKLTQFDLGEPVHAGIVFGQPNIYIPPHPAPSREIFIILAGSSHMIMPDGQAIDLVPGSLFIADDVGVTKGRGGSAGPCGYIALDLNFASHPLPEFGPSYDKK